MEAMCEENQYNTDIHDTNDDDSQEVEHIIHIPRRLRGRRLDKFIQNRFPAISRTVIQRYIKQGKITVNELPSKASHEPAAGDNIKIILPPPRSTELIPENIPLNIIYEDDWYLVLNKHAGIICHPAHGNQSGTIANAVAYHADQLSAGSEPYRPGIVHRLDKNTTGVMMIAKTDEAHWRLSMQFERRTIKKEYFAICEGQISLDGDVINKPLAPHPETTQRMILPGANPPRQAMFKEAITEYRVDTRYKGFTTVNLFPKTGRTHQLRVHLSSLGHPIVGDRMYGGHWISEKTLTDEGSEEILIDHQALHARRLKMHHPFKDEPIEFEAPLPENMKRILSLLQKHRSRQVN